MHTDDLRRLPLVRALFARPDVARRVRQLRELVEAARRVARPPASRPPAVPALDRNAKVLFAANRQGLGLEIGPSFGPIAAKSDGFNVEVLDHASADELREKYRGHQNVDISRIEEVDHLWRGEPLDELLGGKRYDWIIASHVVEHIPNLVSFFQQCARILAPGGVLSLVIPDKRYCFDYFRWPSTTGDLLQAFADQRRRHPAGVVFDHTAQIVKRAQQVSWNAQTRGDFTFFHDLSEAKAAFDHAQASSEYVDVHGWRFTPASFRLSLIELRLLGLIPLEEVCSFPTEGSEFFVTLKPTAASPPRNVDRMALYHQVAHELLEGIQEKNNGKFVG